MSREFFCTVKVIWIGILQWNVADSRWIGCAPSGTCNADVKDSASFSKLLLFPDDHRHPGRALSVAPQIHTEKVSRRRNGQGYTPQWRESSKEITHQKWMFHGCLVPWDLLVRAPLNALGDLNVTDVQQASDRLHLRAGSSRTKGAKHEDSKTDGSLLPFSTRCTSELLWMSPARWPLTPTRQVRPSAEWICFIVSQTPSWNTGAMNETIRLSKGIELLDKRSKTSYVIRHARNGHSSCHWRMQQMNRSTHVCLSDQRQSNPLVWQKVSSDLAASESPDSKANGIQPQCSLDRFGIFLWALQCFRMCDCNWTRANGWDEGLKLACSSIYQCQHWRWSSRSIKSAM